MKPILFNTDMVRAILEGRKTVTRRLVKPQPPATAHVSKVRSDYGWSFWEDNPEKHYMKLPYQPGDILWVRETWQAVYETEWSEDKPTGMNIRRRIPNFDSIPKVEAGLSQECSSMAMSPRMKYFVFKASDIEYADDGNGLFWRPSIHMPREAARIFLRVTGVRVDRLDDMTTDDVFMEGVFPTSTFEHIRDRWHQVWNSTIKPKDRPTYGWEANPWVWVIDFERIRKP